ncbi:MAG: hypothetical protein ACKPEQ_30415, partial [Dolichospermum sp.]
RETYHQSQIILISQEKCPEMQCLDKELYPFQCLELLGINNREILENIKKKFRILRVKSIDLCWKIWYIRFR